ncbi:hypothetical protein [Glycomyces terrestris]|uniref:Uncharacterized protein n=1 Tax=Glycomyces terrestris TaxID=2493553 RepID=A0A426URV6_9ACTN|nr:hypothetical protein [Glycomyces terrestris]RRR95818.1 hypothetical protein EIW28_23295 [Glycomyces terrestris]
MTELPVTREPGRILVGALPSAPEQTALVEARGALLAWDQLDRRAHPAADVWDPALAADWLWEVYGPDAAAAILDGADTAAAEWDSPVLAAARDLAHLHWAAAWWPASHAAAVPALPQGLLRAETAWRTAALDHLLDDEEAVERALAGVDLGALPTGGDLAAPVAALRERLADLAETYGVALRNAFSPKREDWALAAGGTAAEPPLASGAGPIDWAAVPPGLLDAAGEATWRLTQREGAWIVTVTAPAAPEARPADLTARFGAVEIPLRLDAGSGAFTGEATAGPDVALHLDGGVQVSAPWFALPTADAGEAERRAALIAFARGRLTAEDATLTERAAA